MLPSRFSYGVRPTLAGVGPDASYLSGLLLGETSARPFTLLSRVIPGATDSRITDALRAHNRSALVGARRPYQLDPARLDNGTAAAHGAPALR